jgi:hypothetical protein
MQRHINAPVIEPKQDACVHSQSQNQIFVGKCSASPPLVQKTAGYRFGLGFQTVDRYGASGMAGVGAFGWSECFALIDC